MIYIIEGPDGSGKSYLARKLAKQLNLPMIHREKPETQEDKDNMMRSYIEVIKKGKSVVYDRAWYSEMVYGDVMRDASVISYPQMYELEKLLAKKGAMLIYCMGNPSKLWERAQERGEDYIKMAQEYLQICAGYDVLMNVPHYIPVLKYEYKDM